MIDTNSLPMQSLAKVMANEQNRQPVHFVQNRPAQTMKTKILTASSSVMAVIVTLCAASSAIADTFSDGFNEGTLDPYWWTIDTSSGNCTVALTNESVVMTQGSVGQAILKFNCSLPGDVIATVDYLLLNWPNNNGERIGIRTGFGAVERISDNGFGGERYVTDVNSIINTLATSDSSGTLKIQRIGTVTTGYYLQNGTWTPIASTDSHNSSDCKVELSIWPGGITQGVKAAFKNFSVTASEWAATPQLAIARSGANVIVTWPTNVPGFTLQSTTNLLSTPSWSDVFPAPVISNGKNTATNNIADSQRFFRLRR
jgi:hypothetical protein